MIYNKKFKLPMLMSNFLKLKKAKKYQMVKNHLFIGDMNLIIYQKIKKYEDKAKIDKERYGKKMKEFGNYVLTTFFKWISYIKK